MLDPTETCAICSEAFGAGHLPVALPCQHIFGHKCIKTWLAIGQSENKTCPTCRKPVVKERKTRPAYNAESVWTALCKEPPDRLHILMLSFSESLRILWRRKPDGVFNVTDILNVVVIPGLVKVGNVREAMNDDTQNLIDPIFDAYELLAATWNSMGRPNRAVGLAIPFVRLARLMSTAASLLSKSLMMACHTNLALWTANSCMGIYIENIEWEFLVEAVKLETPRYLPLLHAYTMFISQTIAPAWPRRRHEIMNLVVQKCCTRIADSNGTKWKGRPSNAFKELLVVVYEELRRYQYDKGMSPLCGRDAEVSIVKGAWALAACVAKT